jgi:predicted flap endonuclease-1-like 5' DNA nuclease
VTAPPDLPLPHIGGPANRALAEAGITSLHDLATCSEKQVADLHGMGPKGIRILKAALAEHGLAFAERSATTRSVGPA